MDYDERFRNRKKRENVRKTSSATTLRDGQERVHIDHEVEKKLVLKLDFHIKPIVMMVYLITFFDTHYVLDKANSREIEHRLANV